MRTALLHWSVAMVAAFLTALYFGNTFLYLTPPNPVKARLLRYTLALQHPLFGQNWHLFAPNPIRSNYVLAGRCLAGSHVTLWQDLTTPRLARHQQNRFTPMGKTLRPIQNGLFMILGRSSPWDEWTPLICKKMPGDDLCRRSQARTAARATGTMIIQRLVSSACARLPDVRRVQARILIHDPPPWSRRHEPDLAGRTRYVTFPWMDYVQWGAGAR